jgi:hypothetical protein
VKSSAYLQSWNQRRVSAIIFSGLTGRSWSNESAGYSHERELRADVYVFAIHTCRQPDEYDPLNLRYWQLRVAGAAALREHGARSITMRILDQIAPIGYRLDEIADAIERVYRDNPTA